MGKASKHPHGCWHRIRGGSIHIFIGRRISVCSGQISHIWCSCRLPINRTYNSATENGQAFFIVFTVLYDIFIVCIRMSDSECVIKFVLCAVTSSPCGVAAVAELVTALTSHLSTALCMFNQSTALGATLPRMLLSFRQHHLKSFISRTISLVPFSLAFYTRHCIAR